jgi:acetyl esterase
MAMQKGYRYDPSATYPVAERDVQYLDVDGTTRLVRIYQPQGQGPFPILLSVHGGAWTDKDHTDNAVTSRPLAASGMVVAAIALRTAPAFPYPSMVQDTNYAVRWLKAHAADFNGDAEVIGGIGYSSGGHTLPLAAMRPNDPRYSAHPLDGGAGFDAKLDWMIACWPVIDSHARFLVAKAKGAERLVANSLGYFLNEDAMHEGNPQELLARGEVVELLPTLVIHGTADENVPIEHAERFVASYKAAGAGVQYECFEGQPHGFANEPGPQTDQLVEVVKAFIAKRIPSLVGEG